MNSKEIAINFLSNKALNGISIFEDSQLFGEVLFWSRESAFELLSRQVGRSYLASKVYEVGSVVDKYMLDRSAKMLKRGLANKNGLYTRLQSSGMTIQWLMQRWLNIYMNLVTNENYKEHCDVFLQKAELANSEDPLSIILLEEELALKTDEEDSVALGAEMSKSGQKQMVLIF